MEINIELAWRDMDRVIRRQDIVVVVDVLRASTTIATAFVNGAERVYAVESLRQAQRIRQERPQLLLCGERGGIKPEGFDLGNSPLEYTPETVGGRELLITTTDGTKAMIHAQKVGRPVLIGSCVNCSAASKEAFELAAGLDSGISIVSAGRRGEFSLEDFLGAGLIVKGLPKDDCLLSDTALAAVTLANRERGEFLRLFNASSHARELREIGLEKDVDFASEIDKFNEVPILRPGKTYFETEERL